MGPHQFKQLVLLFMWNTKLLDGEKDKIDTWCCCFWPSQLWWIFGKVSNWVYPIQKYPENRPQIQNRPLNREWNQPTNPRTALQIHVTGSANSRLLLGKTQTILQFSIQNWANAGGSKVGKWLMWRRKKWHRDQGASRHICLSSWELHWRTSSSLFGKTQAHHHQYHNILKWRRWWWFLRCIWWWSGLQPWSRWWW